MAGVSCGSLPEQPAALAGDLWKDFMARRANGGNTQQHAGRNHAQPWDTASLRAPFRKTKKMN